jgi:hypothetical protein
VVSKLLRQDDYIKSRLVTVMWQNGRDYGGHLASCMIGSVLANRFRLGWGTWLQVLDNIPKYSATIEQPAGTPAIWEPEFVKLLHEVEGIFDGTQDYAKGGLYWADTRYIETDFFKDKILADKERHPSIGSMNSLMIFR